MITFVSAVRKLPPPNPSATSVLIIYSIYYQDHDLIHFSTFLEKKLKKECKKNSNNVLKVVFLLCVHGRNGQERLAADWLMAAVSLDVACVRCVTL